MTEEQAKTKWCPMVRGGLNVYPTYGNVQEPGPEQRNPAGARCIGSHCMMWRWTRAAEQVRVRDEIHLSSGEGRCGLAGTEHV
jgi:hypothetical protein